MKLSVKIRGSIIVILIISLFFNLFSISNVEAIEEIVVEEPAEETLTLEDLTGPESLFAEIEEVEELSLEDIEIELPDLLEEIEEIPAAEPVSEISFEGLEELFKED